MYVGNPYYLTQFLGAKRSLVKKRDSFPIYSTLESILKDPTILDFIDNPHKRSDDILEHFCDGELFESHALFSRDLYALHI